jgi:hypothetical protein
MTPQERVEGVFTQLRDAHELVAIGNNTTELQKRQHIDALINQAYIEAGALMLPEAEADIRSYPESWREIQCATALFRKYFSFLLSKNGGTATNQMREFTGVASEVLSRQPPDRETALITKHPFVGTIAAQLSKAAVENDPRLERQYGEWLFDIFDHVEQSQSALDRYVSRVTGQSSDPLARQFLQDFKADMEDFLVACVHMGSSLAMHAQEEDCAVYMPLTSYHVPSEDASEVKREMSEILALPVYQEYKKNIQHAGVEKSQVNVPTFLSVYDVREFTSFLSSYLQKLAAGRMRIDVQPVRTAKSDPRIKFSPIDKQFGDFNMRIDYDRHGDIALDIGGAQYQDALQYARELGEDSRNHEMVMRYSSIVDKYGSLTKVERPNDLFQRGERYRYTSVMLSSLSASAKMALVAAGIIKAGQEIVFPYGDAFTYHLRGRLNTPEYRKNFASIAQTAKKTF